MTHKTIMIGLLRFSVLTPTYYSERFPTLDKAAEHLFSDDRMALRFRLFENLCLPSLVQQTDPDFHCVVLTAETMPEVYKKRLETLLAPYPNITCRPVGTDRHYQLIKQGYKSVPTGDASHKILFRLDDDDAVDLGFVERTKRLANGVLALGNPDLPTAISYNRGYYADLTGGAVDVFDACERAPLSTGTALLAPVGFARNPYRYNHRALAQHFNLYSDISVPGFIRTIHGDNKSRPTQMGITRKQGDDVIDRNLRRHFALSLTDLKAL
jgi:hypothetical protein